MKAITAAYHRQHKETQSPLLKEPFATATLATNSNPNRPPRQNLSLRALEVVGVEITRLARAGVELRQRMTLNRDLQTWRY